MEDFEEYKKQGEPEQSKKAENWGIAIGLQKVDNLTPSKYLIKVAKENIEGKTVNIDMPYFDSMKKISDKEIRIQKTNSKNTSFER